ncbi:MAG TPA: hypothetical protein DHM90_13515, partial [Clostridiaceae bacterium]|nr:hypothetical protein [Clostridiaceae bacterium]
MKDGPEAAIVPTPVKSELTDAKTEYDKNIENTTAGEENNDNSEENFPIKTAESDTSFSDKTDKNETEQAPGVDKLEPVVDNLKKEQAPQNTKDAVNSSETKKTSEVAVSKPQTPAAAPAAPKPQVEEITYKAVSYTRWVTTPLNMRTGPGKDYELISSIPIAQSVLVTSISSNGWAKITFGGKEGFVSGKYLS